MANAQQILDRKAAGRGAIVAITGDASVVAAAQMMNDHQIGALVVIDDGRLQGIFTERDVMRRVVAERRDAEATQVRDVMTTPVACAAPHTPYAELCSVMRDKRVRHLPVVDDEAVVGMISIGDLNRAENADQGQTIRYLEQYISVP